MLAHVRIRLSYVNVKIAGGKYCVVYATAAWIAIALYSSTNGYNLFAYVNRACSDGDGTFHDF